MGRLSGKVAIITGASQGMGEAHAKMFVAEGAKVILTDVNDKDGQALADSLGDNAMFIKQDVRFAPGWKAVVEQGEAKFGTINVLVNNAGIIQWTLRKKTISLFAISTSLACIWACRRLSRR